MGQDIAYVDQTFFAKPSINKILISAFN